MEQNLRLTEYTKSYKTWIRRPFPLIMEFYLLNCTNVEDFGNWRNVKPEFVEMGPYVFTENVYRVGVNYREDDTIVAFNQTKTWNFVPSLSNGNIDDIIWNINPVVAVRKVLNLKIRAGQ